LEFHKESSPDSSPIEILRARPDANVCHGFVGRTGGTSSGPYSSLNLSYLVGDDSAAVDTNWDRLRHHVPALNLIARVNQVHGKTIHTATRETASSRPRADGIVTRDPNLILGIFSADCVPILMLDPKQKIAAALHAGWRGTLADIAIEGIKAMTKLGAQLSDISAALGPSIGPCCFEVDSDLADQFATKLGFPTPSMRPAESVRPSESLRPSESSSDSESLCHSERSEEPRIFFAANHSNNEHARIDAPAKRFIRQGGPGKSYLDLRAIITDQLTRAGLAPANITSIGPCTRCAHDRFFSRRAASGQTTGLQLSFIGFAEIN
jgi:polyphenol oxidase